MRARARGGRCASSLSCAEERRHAEPPPMPWRRRRRRHAVAKTSWHVSSMTDCMRCPVECPLACDTFFFIVAAGFYRLNVLSQLSQIKKREETFSPEGQSRHLMSPNLILRCYPDVIIRLFGGCSLGVSAFSTIGDISFYGACTLHSPPPQQAGAPLSARVGEHPLPTTLTKERERERERERGRGSQEDKKDTNRT